MTNRAIMTFSRRPLLSEINCLRRKYEVLWGLDWCWWVVLLGAYLGTNVFIPFEIETIYPKNVVLKRLILLMTFKLEPGGVSDRMLFAYISQLLVQWYREFCLRRDKIINVVKGHLRSPLKLGWYFRSTNSFDVKYSARWQQNVFVNFAWFSE